MSTYTFVPSMNKHNERFPAEFSYFVEYKRGSLCISSSSDLRILLNEEEYMNFFHPDIKCDISITDMDRYGPIWTEINMIIWVVIFLLRR